MDAQDRAAVKLWAQRLKVLMDELEFVAQEVEAYVMKKTTQRSPEFRGRANC